MAGQGVDQATAKRGKGIKQTTFYLQKLQLALRMHQNTPFSGQTFENFL